MLVKMVWPLLGAVLASFPWALSHSDVRRSLLSHPSVSGAVGKHDTVGHPRHVFLPPLFLAHSSSLGWPYAKKKAQHKEEGNIYHKFCLFIHIDSAL